MRIITLTVVAFVTLSGWLSVCNSSKVLVLLPISPRSQKNAFDPIVEELSKRNHDITYVTMYKPSKVIKGVTTVLMDSSLNDFLDNIMEDMFNTSVSVSFTSIPKIVNTFGDLCETLFQNKQFQTFMKNPGSYDVTLVNSMMNECYLPIASKIGAPIVIVSAPTLFPNLAWALDIPNPPSYLPMTMLPFNFTMTFFQRAINLVVSGLMNVMFICLVAPISESVVRRHVPDAELTYSVIKNASLILVNSHVSFEGSRPGMPYMIEVGCLHCTSGKQLPKELEEFVDGSGSDGFIVFSLGTVVKGTFMTQHFVKTFIEAFSQMKQRVIWKYEKKLEGLPSNVKIVSWLPQQDLMAHPKCKLAITHGGLLSLQEVAYHGVPMLGVPLGADRVRNIHRASEMGFARSLDDWDNLNTEGLTKTLNELIYDTRYREKAEQLSALMKDRPEHPVQTAAYWVEYVIRHKGAPHLKSGAQHLNIFQYFLIDVFGLLFLIILILLFLIVFFTKIFFSCCLRLCFGSKNAKEKIH